MCFYYSRSLINPFWNQSLLMETAFPPRKTWNDLCFHLDSISSCNRVYMTKLNQYSMFQQSSFRYNVFQNFPFLSATIKWLNFNISICNSPCFEVCRKCILSFIRPSSTICLCSTKTFCTMVVTWRGVKFV